MGSKKPQPPPSPTAESIVRPTSAPPPRVRLNLALSKRTSDLIILLKHRLNMDSKTEVIRRALEFLEEETRE